MFVQHFDIANFLLKILIRFTIFLAGLTVEKLQCLKFLMTFNLEWFCKFFLWTGPMDCFAVCFLTYGAPDVAGHREFP